MQRKFLYDVTNMTLDGMHRNVLVHVTAPAPIQSLARHQYYAIEKPFATEQFAQSETKEETCCHDVEIAIHAITTRKTLEVIVQENVSDIANEFCS